MSAFNLTVCLPDCKAGYFSILGCCSLKKKKKEASLDRVSAIGLESGLVPDMASFHPSQQPFEKVPLVPPAGEKPHDNNGNDGKHHGAL